MPNAVTDWAFGLLGRLPSRWLARIVTKLAEAHCRRVPSEPALRFLFELDKQLYSLQGQVAVAYGSGTHPKHRLTRYHDFFTERINPGERVLDVGCGIGAVARDIAQKCGAHVVGIDLRESNISQAIRENSHPNVCYRVGNVLTDLPHESFDVVVLSNILEHLPNRTEFLRRLLETASPSRVLLRVPLFERDWRVPLKKELGVEWALDPEHTTEYTADEFRDELESAGLKVVHGQVNWGEIWAEAVPNNG